MIGFCRKPFNNAVCRLKGVGLLDRSGTTLRMNTLPPASCEVAVS
ncbi:hypothetical protein [Baaleninema simplex]|nr:hypothetical protein [Baaleninema simplex]